MKKIIIGLATLSSITAFASDMDIQKCNEKVSKAVKSVASLEIGRDLMVSDVNQERLSTATKFEVTVQSTRKLAQLVYKVETIDLGETSRCIIGSIVLQ